MKTTKKKFSKSKVNSTKKVDLKYLEILSKKCRFDIVRMISNAGSGHIGGSLSSVDIYAFLRTFMESEDRLVISHGHTSAAIYSVLGNTGYFDIEDAVASFRKAAPYEGHPSIKVDGIEWCSGALGQGLSVGCGFALAKKLKNEPGTIYVVMGDGEQEKGQLQEAREFAVKHNLDNLVAIVDFNGLQASGTIADISAQRVYDKYSSCGWAVKQVCGHDFKEIEESVSNIDSPTCIIANTVMGKGIPEIENDYNFHGTLIDNNLKELSLERFKLNDEELSVLKQFSGKKFILYPYPKLDYTESAPYSFGESVDVRSGLGKALADLAVEFPEVPFAALDCDLEASVKLSGIKANREKAFIECGIAEHNSATVAAAMAKSGIIAFQADFSVFNIAETYSQNRMADLNKAPIKLLSTHAGLDVGEDGKTHQCVEYLSLMSNLLGFEVIVPADANQAVSAVRYAASSKKAVAVIAGRSKMPILCDEKGEKLGFKYGRGEWLKRGTKGVIITYGNMAHKALKVAEILSDNNIDIGILNLSTPLKLDKEKVLEAAKTGFVLTYEDHIVHSGIAGLVAKLILENKVNCYFVAKGVTKYGSSASPDNLYKEQGLDAESVAKEIIGFLKT